MSRRLIAFIVCVCLALSSVCALAEDASGENSTSFTLAGLDTSEYRSWKDNTFFSYMEELTGVHFEMEQFSDAAKWETTKAMYTASSDLPDVLFMADLSSAECIDLEARGVLIDLMPYLEENCPNLWAILQKNPEYLDAITLPDGTVAALPYINETPTQNVMWINRKFLENLHLTAPTTADELVTVLEAFLKRDANGNGNSNDEIPLSFLGSFDLKYLAHAFGLYCNDYNVFVQDGQVRYMPLEENFREFITWCKDLYDAGLIDHDGFNNSDSMRQVTDDSKAQTIGILIMPMVTGILPSSWVSDYEILMPLSYNGKQIYRSLNGNVTRGTFAVTSACTDIPAVLKWVDTLYTEQGSILAAVGKEGVDYTVDADNEWTLSESAAGNSYYSVTNTLLSSIPIPGISLEDFQNRYVGGSIKKVTDSMKAFNSYCVAPFPYYDLTTEQQRTIMPLQNDLGYYVDMQIARWILGEVEISDESFTEFKDTLNEKGLPEFLAFWQGILEAK